MQIWISNQFEHFPIPAYLLLFIVLWLGICQLISSAGGWRALSRDYRAAAPFEGKKLWFKSGGMRYWTNYNNCLVVGANKYGLYVSVLPIFRAGHPPLLIPWTDISTRAATRRLLPDVIKFSFAKQPDVPLIFPKKLAAKIFQTRQDSQRGFNV